MLRKPPSFVVTTPESLYLLVTSDKGRELLRTVETVIVDEIHAVARDKRGAHLALTLERLEALCDTRPHRIGLSATQRPIETVGRLLVGDRPLPAIVDAGHQRDLDLALELPEGELEAVTSAEQMSDVLDRIAALVERAPHHHRVRQHPPAGRAARAPARRAPGRRRRRRSPRQPLEGAPATGSRRDCVPATCGRWSPPRRSSSGSTSGRWSWCARSARRAASPRSCNASAARTTAGRARRRDASTR